MKQIRSRTKGAKRVASLWLLLVLFLCAGTCLVAMDVLVGLEMMKSRLTSLCESARAAYRRGGSPELSSMARFAEVAVGIRPHLLDSNGRDLADGADGSALLSSAGTAPPIPLLPPPRHLLVEQSAAGACVASMVLPPPGRRMLPGPAVLFMLPSLWFLPFLAVLCGAVAVYVSLRMRKIEAAVVDFGSGKLSVRMEPGLGDPFGRLSRAFNEMAERIESLMGSHKRLCLDISHELRSPLARLGLSLRLARSGSAGALDRIELETARLSDLVDQLLEIARDEADPDSFRAEPVDLRWLLTDIVDRCDIEARGKGCQLRLQVAFLGRIAADPELLRSAIENVLRNAIRHSPAGAPIELSAHRENDWALVAVSDQGPGVPEGELEAIFQPFYRLDSDRGRNGGGTGLGLAIARRAILLHRGSIVAKNQRPGLRVEIRIPHS